MTATSSRRPVRKAARAAVLLIGSVLAAGCTASAGTAKAFPPVRTVAARPAPPGWRHASLADGGAVLAYPPGMHLIAGDRGAASAAKFSVAGAFLMYLNATPKQGAETLRDWPEFRVEHLLDEDASAVRTLAESHDVRFLGGTGSCVMDAYVTRTKAHHYTEIACFVRGTTSASVIVAAAPTAKWADVAGELMRAVAAYQVR